MYKELESLCRRFISDNNLQFQYVDYLHFLYCLGLFGYEKQWYGLLEMIKNRFDNNPNKFLEKYYKIRDKIITDFLDKKSCQAVMQLLERELNTVESVFIISHHADELELPVDSEIKVVKNESGISELF